MGPTIAKAIGKVCPERRPRIVRPKQEPNTEQVELLAHLETARREWATARAYFELVSDEDLVDYAIYSVRAAEKKYQYLLRKIRETRKTPYRDVFPEARFDVNR